MALNNVPLPGQSLAVTQAPINNNFSTIDTAFSVDHVAYQASGQGKHKKVTFPAQGSAPVTGGGEVALFAALSPYTGVTELSFANESAGSIYEFTSAAGSLNGWARLPSGILFKWGEGTANGLTTITFPAGANIPAFSNIFQILITTAYNAGGADGNGFVRLNNFTAPYTQFNVYGSQRTTTTTQAVNFNYLAIGV